MAGVVEGAGSLTKNRIIKMRATAVVREAEHSPRAIPNHDRGSVHQYKVSRTGRTALCDAYIRSQHHDSETRKQTQAQQGRPNILAREHQPKRPYRQKHHGKVFYYRIQHSNQERQLPPYPLERLIFLTYPDRAALDALTPRVAQAHRNWCWKQSKIVLEAASQSPANNGHLGTNLVKGSP